MCESESYLGGGDMDDYVSKECHKTGRDELSNDQSQDLRDQPKLRANRQANAVTQRITAVSWRLRGLLEYEDSHKPTRGYSILLWATDLDEKEPIGAAVTGREGHWTIHLSALNHADEIVRHIRNDSFPEICVEVRDPSGKRTRHDYENEAIDPSVFLVLTIAEPTTLRRNLKSLQISGKLENISKRKRHKLRNLQIEVWDRHSHQEEPLAVVSASKDHTYQIEIPVSDAVPWLNNSRPLHLRIRDSETGRLVACINSPLRFDNRGNAIQDIKLPEIDLPEPPRRTLDSIVLELLQHLEPSAVPRLQNAGIEKVADLVDQDLVQISKEAEVKLEALELLLSLEQSADVIFGDQQQSLDIADWFKMLLNRAQYLGHWPLFDSPRTCILPTEETWEYRFTPHEEYTDIDAFNDYWEILETEFVPRAQKIVDFLEAPARQRLITRMRLEESYNAVLAQLGTEHEREDDPLFYLRKQPLFDDQGYQYAHMLNGPILRHLHNDRGAARGPDDRSYNLHAQILDRSVNVLNFVPGWDPNDPYGHPSAVDTFRVELQTCDVKNAASRNNLGYTIGCEPYGHYCRWHLGKAPSRGRRSYYDLTTKPTWMGCDTSIFFWSLGSAIEACDYPHTLSKSDEDGWCCANWKVEVRLLHPLKRIHPDFDPTGTRSFDLGYHPVLYGIASSHWLDCENEWDEGLFTGKCTSSLGISSWPNHLRELDGELKDFADDLEDLVSDLTRMTDIPLLERLDEILLPVLRGNEAFVQEYYQAAVDHYREARRRLSKVRKSDQSTCAYKRLRYIISLLIGDAYWGHREYERAINHFLIDTCPKRNVSTWDDHFLWNHVAECMLDWADRRYRMAGQDSQKLITFGLETIENHISLEDPDGMQDGQQFDPLKPQNPDGALVLYERVLSKCFNCSDHPIPTFLLRSHSSEKFDSITLAFNYKSRLRFNKEIQPGLRINKNRAMSLREADKGLAEKLGVQVAFTTAEAEPILAKEIEHLTIYCKTIPENEVLTITDVHVYGVHSETEQYTLLFSNDITNCQLLSDTPLTDLAACSGLVCDLTPTRDYDSACGVSYSQKLLLRAQIGADSIRACRNALGLRHDFVPVYRYEYLHSMALDSIGKTKGIAGAYVTARQMLEETSDRKSAAKNAVAQAGIALDNELEGLELTGIDRALANDRITALLNQRSRLSEELDDARDAGLVGLLTSTVQGASAGAMATGSPAGAIAGGSLALLTGAMELGVTLDNLANDIDRRQQAIDDELILAGHEVVRANHEELIQQNRVLLAGHELDWLSQQEEKFETDSYRNPEIWLKIAGVYKRLLHIAMARTLYLCFSAQKAIEFEIDVDQNDPAWADNVIQFDYLDQIDDGEKFAATLQARGISTDEGTYATGVEVLGIHLDELNLYRHKWYQVHTPQLTFTELYLKDDFPVQYHQLIHTPATEDEVTLHFSTPIWLFDNKNRGFHAYGQIVYVDAVYELGQGATPGNYSIRLFNSHRMKEEVTPDFNRYTYAGFSYWRVPEPTEVLAADCREEPYDENDPHHNINLMDDWVNYDVDIDVNIPGRQPPQPWVLKAKLTSALDPDPSKQQSARPPQFIEVLYNDPNSEAHETLESLRERYENQAFLFKFENTGLHTDWTLVLNNTSGGNPHWSNIDDVNINIFWRSSYDLELDGLVSAQLDALYRSRKYVRNFLDDGADDERGAFEELFDNDHFYTELTGHPNNRIDFAITNVDVPQANPMMQGVYIWFVFEDAAMESGDIPELTVRLTKSGIVDSSGQPVELIFTVPTAPQEQPYECPAEFIDQDPTGDWHFQMLAADNQDLSDPASTIDHAALINLLMVIEYTY